MKYEQKYVKSAFKYVTLKQYSGYK